MTALVTPLYDDLFDVYKYDTTLIESLTFDPAHAAVDSFIGKVSAEVSKQLLETAPDAEAYRAACRSVFDIQVETLKQFDRDISPEVAEQIAFGKGASSFVFYYTHMAGLPDAALAEVFYDVGGLQQTSNDLFDVYKDNCEGVFTWANTCKNFTSFRKFFIERIRQQNRKIQALPYPGKSKVNFSLVMQSIEARGLVAIDHFIRLERKVGKGLDWDKLCRKDMIVNMERPANFLKWLYYIWKISRLC